MAEGGGPTFETTPSWIIGAVVFVIITISWVIEKLIDLLGNISKINPAELMLMGFVSLLIALAQDNTKGWCIPEELSLMWLPCHTSDSTGGRHLAEDSGTSVCKEGKVPLLSLTVLHELHYLIFILALAHAINCTITVLLGEAKISLWRKWEESIRYQIDLDDGKVLETRSLTFIRERFDGVDAKKRHYVYSFFNYLGGVVTKADYEAMRMGFILAHCNGNQRFNFHNYVVYAYEADFKKVVSIRWFLWIFAVVSLSLNVAGWNIYFWFSFIPLFLSLVVGTKLEKVITDLATYVAQRHTVIVGEIRLYPSDDYFWFKRPKIMLMAIHAILFMNSFGFAIFFWTLFKFKFYSCLMGDPKLAIARVFIMLVVQFICSFSFLPLYAIVTQMGSSFNKEGMSRYSAASTHSTRIPEEIIASGTVLL
ncbi:MLO-like protein 15 [Silene latifolia]|uniref:MLO-like protein 15 n=1 Tax=Silene latifolia TaxID=37657 RepID=UPI003D775511